MRWLLNLTAAITANAAANYVVARGAYYAAILRNQLVTRWVAALVADRAQLAHRLDQH
jgi:hypothetical protein